MDFKVNLSKPELESNIHEDRKKGDNRNERKEERKTVTFEKMGYSVGNRRGNNYWKTYPLSKLSVLMRIRLC